MDEARRKVAMLYLGDKALSMTDVARRRGYSEAAAFTRAFKRGTGSAPSVARVKSTSQRRRTLRARRGATGASRRKGWRPRCGVAMFDSKNPLFDWGRRGA